MDCKVRRGRELRRVELGLKGGYCSATTVSFFVTLGEAVEWGFGGLVGMGAWVGGREDVGMVEFGFCWGGRGGLDEGRGG